MSSDIKSKIFSSAHYHSAAKHPLESLSALGYAAVHLMRSAGDGCAYIIAFDKRMRILHKIRLKRRGAMSSETVADVVGRVVDELKASYFILIHDHKNGILTPSAADRITTDLLLRKYRDSGTVFLEHFIVSGDDYVTMIQKTDSNKRYDSD